MTSIITTPNAGVVLTAADVRQQCRIDLTDEDAWIEGVAIPQTIGLFENETRCKLLTTTMRQLADAWPSSGALRLDWGVVIDVVDVRYLDTGGTERVLASTAYEVLPVTAGISVLQFIDPSSLPELADRAGAVRINYRVGFGGDASAVPKAVRAWLLAHVAVFYGDGRQAASERELHLVPFIQNIIADLVRQPI